MAGTTSLKECINDPILAVICYGYLKKDPKAADEAELFKYLRKYTAENKQELFDALSLRIRINETAESVDEKISSIFVAFEKALE